MITEDWTKDPKNYSGKRLTEAAKTRILATYKPGMTVADVARACRTAYEHTRDLLSAQPGYVPVRGRKLKSFKATVEAVQTRLAHPPAAPVDPEILFKVWRDGETWMAKHIDHPAVGIGPNPVEAMASVVHTIQSRFGFP